VDASITIYREKRLHYVLERIAVEGKKAIINSVLSKGT